MNAVNWDAMSIREDNHPTTSRQEVEQRNRAYCKQLIRSEMKHLAVEIKAANEAVLEAEKKLKALETEQTQLEIMLDGILERQFAEFKARQRGLCP